MKTKLTTITLMAVVCGAGLVWTPSSPAQTADGSQSPSSTPPPAATDPGVNAADAPSDKLPPMDVPARPARPARTQPQSPPGQIGSWKIGHARLSVGATPGVRVSADSHNPERGVAKVDLVSLRW